MCSLARTWNDNLCLALPEHRVRLTRDAYRTNVNAAWGLLSLLEFDIIRYNDVCKQSLDFVDCKEPSWADGKI